MSATTCRLLQNVCYNMSSATGCLLQHVVCYRMSATTCRLLQNVCYRMSATACRLLQNVCYNMSSATECLLQDVCYSMSSATECLQVFPSLDPPLMSYFKSALSATTLAVTVPVFGSFSQSGRIPYSSQLTGQPSVRLCGLRDCQ